MAWFEDLAPCSYFMPEWTFLRAIGWLEAGHPFPTGVVEQRIYDTLLELLRNPWQPFVFAGVHQCDVCWYTGPYGGSNLFVPGTRCVFVCPQLIVHYMNAHGYRPPEEFCRAVLACPPTHSMPYFKALLANGGRPLITAALHPEQTFSTKVCPPPSTSSSTTSSLPPKADAP